MATREQLLDSVAHKLRHARYHAQAVLDVLELNPPDAAEDPRRVELEAHLEGPAYTGTAATEKTIRAVAPDEIQDQARVEQMLAVARRRDAVIASGLARWWQDGARELPKIARELRNDAAHCVYEKRPLGPTWVLEIDRRDPIPSATSHGSTVITSRRSSSFRSRSVMQLCRPIPPHSFAASLQSQSAGSSIGMRMSSRLSREGDDILDTPSAT